MRTLARFCLVSLAILAVGCGAPTVRITHQDLTQFEVVSPQGVPLFIDVFDRARLTQKVSPQALMYESYFVSENNAHMDTYLFPKEPRAPGLIRRAGTIETGDLKLTTLGSAENDFPPTFGDSPTNFLGKIETGGLKIVHFGNLGQTTLTEEQRAFLGHPDVVLASLAIRQMDEKNASRLAILEALGPKLVIVGLLSPETLGAVAAKYPVYYQEGPVDLSKTLLPKSLTFLILGKEQRIWATLVKARDWS